MPHLGTGWNRGFGFKASLVSNLLHGICLINYQVSGALSMRNCFWNLGRKLSGKLHRPSLLLQVDGGHWQSQTCILSLCGVMLHFDWLSEHGNDKIKRTLERWRQQHLLEKILLFCLFAFENNVQNRSSPSAVENRNFWRKSFLCTKSTSARKPATTAWPHRI